MSEGRIIVWQFLVYIDENQTALNKKFSVIRKSKIEIFHTLTPADIPKLDNMSNQEVRTMLKQKFDCPTTNSFNQPYAYKIIHGSLGLRQLFPKKHDHNHTVAVAGRLDVSDETLIK